MAVLKSMASTYQIVWNLSWFGSCLIFQWCGSSHNGCTFWRWYVLWYRYRVKKEGSVVSHAPTVAFLDLGFLKDLALSFVTLCKHFIIQPGSSPSHQHLSCWRLFCACLTRDTVLSLTTSFMLSVELQCKLILHIDNFFYITCICYRFVEYNLFSNLLFLAPFIFCIFNAFLLNIYLLQTVKLY